MTAPPTRSTDGRVAGEVVRSLVDDTQQLMRKHLELARHEIVEAVEARLTAAIAGAFAGIVALFGLGFLASGLAFGLEGVMRPWVARVVVGVAFLLLGGIAGLVMRKRMVDPPMAPMRTKQVLEEDREWARTRLGR
ncbi:MAG: phage holin family protein [Nitriliruptorales bacterium]